MYLPKAIPLRCNKCVIPIDQDGRYNLNALHKASESNKNKLPGKWLRLKGTQNLIRELDYNGNSHSAVKVSNGGTGQGTFAHELLVVLYAGWISPKFQLKVSQAFLDMKSAKVKPVTEMSRLDLIMLAKEVEEEKLLLIEKIEETKPFVEALDRIAKADGSSCITDTAKILQMKPKDLFAWLKANHWIYKRAGASHFCGYSGKLQQGLLEHKVTVINRADNSEKTTEQVRVTSKGVAKLAELLSIDLAA